MTAVGGGPGGDLRGSRVLITGGTQGIGAALAAAFLDAGARVVVSGRGDARVADHARALGSTTGGEVVGIGADLADVGSVEQLAQRALDAFGGLDVLVNNAGVSRPESVAAVTLDAWDETMAVNVRAPALLGARIGAAMADAGTSGSIVNLGSAAGITALTEHYAYSTSKAALIMITRMLALEFGPAGVRANVVCPTVVMTEMGQRVWGDPETAAPLLSRVPAGHFAEPRDVTSAVLYLASPAASMINGVTLPVDGGYSIA